jgi:hypothetical protein
LKNVALFGQMYAGKSTIADALSDAGYQRMSFAAPLKNVAALAYGPVNKTENYNVITRDGIPTMLSGREILQKVGQTIKDVDLHFWLKAFFGTKRNYLDQPLVVDDGRFTFEYEALVADGWMTVGILTPDSVRWQRAVMLNGREPTPDEKNHESEIQIPSILDRCDIVVDGTQDPYHNAKRILDEAK